MTTKAHIVEQLAETALLLPELLAAALEANDRAKMRMTLLQDAVIHAENPASPANTLELERYAAGLLEADFDATVKDARALGGGRFAVPGGAMLLSGLYADIEAMLTPLHLQGGAAVEALSKRLETLHAASPRVDGDVLQQFEVARITSSPIPPSASDKADRSGLRRRRRAADRDGSRLDIRA